MAKVYTEKEVIDRLRKEIAANKPLFCPNCGCGLTAKLQAMGGADVICVSATSYWRLKGQGSLAPLIPYSDINKCIMSIVPEVVMNAGDVPVVTLSGGTNPLLPHRKHLEMLREMGVSGINPFMMNRKDYNLMQQIIRNINCSVDKKNSVITIKVTDQDALICATMADSVKQHLQDFIIRYRTSKAKEDVAHYQQMRDSAEVEYLAAMRAYSRYSDTHMDITLQTFQSERDKLENDMMLKQNSLAAMETQLQNTKVKLQEKTPAFTTLKSAIVPVKPAGPKRMIFVVTMLLLSAICTSIYILKGTFTKVILQ